MNAINERNGKIFINFFAWSVGWLFGCLGTSTHPNRTCSLATGLARFIVATLTRHLTVAQFFCFFFFFSLDSFVFSVHISSCARWQHEKRRSEKKFYHKLTRRQLTSCVLRMWMCRSTVPNSLCAWLISLRFVFFSSPFHFKVEY